MTENKQRVFRKIIKYAAVLLIGALIVAGVWVGTKNFEKITPPGTSSSEDQTADRMTQDTENRESESAESKEEPKSSDSEITYTATETEPPIVTVSNEDTMNVDRLIDRYYTAKINDDAEELNKIVDAETTYSEQSLKDENQFIEKYDNFHTYVLPGLTDNYFIVYVKYDIYFNGITVGAPSLNHFIVARQDDTHYYIYDKAISGEFQSYIEETERSETVLSLRRQVEDELEKACDKNADLKFLIQWLNGAYDETGSEEQTGEDDASGSGSQDSET